MTSASASGLQLVPLLGGELAGGLHRGAQQVDGVAFEPLGHFGFVAVPFRVEHRVRPEPVRAQLQEVRSAAGAHCLDGAARGVLDGEDVHAVHGPRRDLVAGGLERHVRLGFRAAQRGAHRVQVVFAAEQHGQLPERGEIEALVEFAFRDGAFAEEAYGGAGAAAHLVRERHADGERQPAGDDRVASVEARGGVEEMHGAAAAPAAALDVAVHLGEDRPGGNPAEQGMAVFPVGREDGVLRFQ